ncbi:MAG TPA: ABC transporter permease subunit [Catenuloplanes sp.]
MSGRPDVPPLGVTVRLDDIGPAQRGRVFPSAVPAVALLLPAALLLGPALWTVVRNVPASFVVAGEAFGTAGRYGHDNYAALLEADLVPVLLRTLAWAVLVPTVVTGLGYWLAKASTRGPGSTPIRLALVAPVAVPMVVTGVMFRLLGDPDPAHGVATWLLTRVAGPNHSWLDASLITPALMLAFIWAWVGMAMVVFRAALDAVPDDLVDTVRGYGGSDRQVFLDAAWRPLLRRSTAIVFALVALGTSRAFDLIRVMAPPPSLSAADVLATQVQRSPGAHGPTAALGVVWMCALAAVMLIAARQARQAWPTPIPPPELQPPVRHRASAGLRLFRRGGLALLIRRLSEWRDTEGAGPDIASGTHRARTGRWRVKRTAERAGLVALALIWTVPILALIGTSMRTPQDAGTRPWWTGRLSLESYRAAINADLLQSLGFTAVLAVTVTVIVVAAGFLAAHALVWLLPQAASWLLVIALAAAVVPVQVMAEPVNLLFAELGLTGTPAGLGLVHCCIGVPFAALIFRNAFIDLPGDRVRAARLAEGREWRVLLRLARFVIPAAVAIGSLEFCLVWNDFAVAYFFPVNSVQPVGPLLQEQTRQFLSASGPLAATSVIVSLLPVAVVLLARKQIVRGLVSGALR